MLDYDSVTSLRHYPLAGGMTRFGLNQYGEPMYRLVFAPTRRHLCPGDWPDGFGLKWVRTYPTVGDCWVLEQWRSASDYTGGATRQEWELQGKLRTCGPYPDRGEYDLLWAFLDTVGGKSVSVMPTVSLVEKLITWSRYGRETLSYDETRVHLQEQEDKRRRVLSATAEDLIRSKLPAYGARPFSGGSVSRGDKTWQPLRSAEELGLPTSGGLRMGKRADRLIETAQPAA